MKGKITAGEIAEKLYHFTNVEHLSDAQAKARAIPFGRQTEFGNVNFESTVRNRSAGITVYIGSEAVALHNMSARQNQIMAAAPETLKRVARYLDRAPLICVERTMGDNELFSPHCTLYVSTYRKECARLAYMWGETLLPYRPTASGPDLSLIYVPEWPEAERQILVYPEEGVTFVLGSDYMGEAKKGFLRMAMWLAKQEGMMGCHAGAKIIQARHADGKLRSNSMLLFGLSATGKTTHSCHSHGLDHQGEEMMVVQDDICFLRPDGSALGTERGFYLKTEGLDPHTQPLLYHAATQPDTIFENVMVDWQGRVDFQDETITSNGRGVVQMANLAPHASDNINLPPLDELDALMLVFITRRNTVQPIISKLNAEQAALAYMLGESVESSAGDPKKAGQSVRVVGTNPFIVGDEAAEGNWIYDFIKRHENKVQAYIVNTGGVGEIRERKPDGTTHIKREVTRIQIPETSAVFRAMVRGKIDWVEEPYFGSLVPREVEGCDLQKYDPAEFYSAQELTDQVNQLKRERREYLEQYPGLNPAIVAACKV
jgi:phosphoenolpyruvate carboxykinase (ATP)